MALKAQQESCCTQSHVGKAREGSKRSGLQTAVQFACEEYLRPTKLLAPQWSVFLPLCSWHLMDLQENHLSDRAPGIPVTSLTSNFGKSKESKGFNGFKHHPHRGKKRGRYITPKKLDGCYLGLYDSWLPCFESKPPSSGLVKQLNNGSRWQHGAHLCKVTRPARKWPHSTRSSGFVTSSLGFQNWPKNNAIVEMISNWTFHRCSWKLNEKWNMSRHHPAEKVLEHTAQGNRIFACISFWMLCILWS